MKISCLFIMLAVPGGPAAVQAQSTSESSSASNLLLQAPAGGSSAGGRVSNPAGTVISDTATGDAISGPVSNTTAGGVRTKSNYTGQLTEVAAISVTATPPTIDERGTRQIIAKATLDDGTTTDLRGVLGAIWGTSLPIASVNPNTGIATAGSVTADTPARVNVTYRGRQGFVDLTVLEKDTVPPDYSGDAIDDAWQVQYFGPAPNPNAAATADPDGDGQNNLFEFLAGTEPNNRASFLLFAATGFSGATTANFRISKVIPGRTYRVKANTTLVSAMTTVGQPFTVTSTETNRLFQDTAATGGRKFYTLEITLP